MPPARIRNGNGLYMRASFEKAHGAQPQPAELEIDGSAIIPAGKVVALLTGGSAWKGRVADWQKKTNNNTGITTVLRCVDVRDDLFNKVIFGAVNIIDERTGEVYSGISEGTIPNEFRDEIVGYQTPLPGYTGASPGYERPIPGMNQDSFGLDIGFRGYGSSEDVTGLDIGFAGFGTDSGAGFQFVFPETFFDITTEMGKIYPRDLLDWLCGVCGFKTAYTPRAFDRLKRTNFGAEDDPGWQDSQFNIYNRDWQNGIKVGAALQDIADSLGLVFSPTNEILSGDIMPEPETPDDFDTIRFYVQGEVDNPTFSWDNVQDYDSHDIGESIQPDVDTGVWIVGEPDRYQVNGRKVVAGWNQNYNIYALDYGRMGQLIADLNENRADNQKISEMVTTMAELAEILKDRDVADAEKEAYETALANGDTEDEAIDAASEAASDYLSNPNPWAETNFLEGKKFEDMTISDYLGSVPFRVYRLDGMEKVLKPDEFTGDRPVRRIPLATPLLTDPTTDYILRGHVCKRDGRKRTQYGLISDGPVDEDETIYPKITDGHRLIIETGHVVFQGMQFELSPKDENGDPDPDKDPKDYLATDIVPDTKLTIDVVYLGDPYRTFWGTDERVGSKSVSNLYRKFQINAAKTEEEAIDLATQASIDVYNEAITDGKSQEEAARLETAQFNRTMDECLFPELSEVVLEGEKTADQIAQDIARSLISRQRVVRSGSVAFKGIAGHEPDEVLRRVSVQVDAEQGISENVSYSDDQPPPGMPSYYEIQNKIAMANKVKELELDKRKSELRAKRNALRQARSDALRMSEREEMAIAALQTLNKDNWMRVHYHDDSTAANKKYSIGEPVIGSYSNTDKKYKTIEDKADISQGDTKFLGVNVVDNQNVGDSLATCTSGICYAKVKGVISQGALLNVAAEGGHFIAADGPLVAMQDTPDAPEGETPADYVQLIRVKIGSSAAAVSRADYAMTEDDVLIDAEDPPVAEYPDLPVGLYADSSQTMRIVADGHEVEEGDIVLASNQPEEQQHIWIVKEDDFWLDMGQPVLVQVTRGDVFPMSFWGLYNPVPTEEDPEPDPYYLTDRAAYF